MTEHDYRLQLERVAESADAAIDDCEAKLRRVRSVAKEMLRRKLLAQQSAANARLVDVRDRAQTRADCYAMAAEAIEKALRGD